MLDEQQQKKGGILRNFPELATYGPGHPQEFYLKNCDIHIKLIEEALQRKVRSLPQPVGTMDGNSAQGIAEGAMADPSRSGSRRDGPPPVSRDAANPLGESGLVQGARSLFCETTASETGDAQARPPRGASDASAGPTNGAKEAHDSGHGATETEAILALFHRVRDKEVITIEKWAERHKLSRTAVFDWKAAGGKPLKGRVSKAKSNEVRAAVLSDASRLGLIIQTGSDSPLGLTRTDSDSSE